jgi:hypothetical protein
MAIHNKLKFNLTSTVWRTGGIARDNKINAPNSVRCCAIDANDAKDFSFCLDFHATQLAELIASGANRTNEIVRRDARVFRRK